MNRNSVFGAQKLSLFVSALAALVLGALAADNAAASKTRPFRMGFTAFPHDITARAMDQTREFVRTNADLIAHHIEGVPWAEALKNEPFPKELMDDRETKRSMKPPGAKVFLAISPGRGDLKLAEKGSTPLPAELKGKTYSDPLVKQAYLNYCRRSIEYFKPDYLCIGIEVNEIFSAGQDKWQAYAELHRHVYQELKKDHPDLPIFASYTLHNLLKHKGGMLKACQELMPVNDFVAISFYPFFISESADTAFKWLTENFDASEKPYAMVETNDTADRTELPKSKIVLNGSPEKQATYVRTLLELALGLHITMRRIGVERGGNRAARDAGGCKDRETNRTAGHVGAALTIEAGNRSGKSETGPQAQRLRTRLFVNCYNPTAFRRAALPVNAYALAFDCSAPPGGSIGGARMCLLSLRESLRGSPPRGNPEPAAVPVNLMTSFSRPLFWRPTALFLFSWLSFH